ncbi:MAG: TIR domain-containing protein [Sphingomicrobium sp.]
MANIFLSYDRDDGPRARPLAALLERNGHKVWWDRAIKGGHEFGTEIEAALADADKVVVLWSSNSVKSAWVRDEAAVGRDKGCLVPATIDGTPAPLGFRQFQTIDLSKWRGRGRSQSVEDLLNALDAPGPEMPTNPSKARRPPARLSRPLLLGAAVILVLALAAGAGMWLSGSFGTSNQITVAIAPEDSSAPSRQAAHEVTVGLSGLTGEYSSAYQIVDAADGHGAKADLILSAAEGRQNGRDHGELSLRSANGNILWSAAIEQPSSASADLGRQLTVRAHRALSCAAEALTYRRERIRNELLKLYVSGCSNDDADFVANVDESDRIKQFEQVVAQAPHFEPAWALLLLSEVTNLQQVDDPPALRRKIGTQIAEAQKLGLDFGELYVAKAETFPANDFVDIFRTYEQGVKRHPENANIYLAASYRETYVGRMIEAVDLGSSALQRDPLSPAKLQNLVLVYAYSGNTDAAYSELRKAEQLWPALSYAGYALDLRFGDPKEALAVLLQDPSRQGPLQAQQAAFLRARIDPTPENIERSIAEDRKILNIDPGFLAQIVQTLAQFGRKDDVLDMLLNYSGGAELAGDNAEVLFRPAFRNLWRDPRSMAAAAHLGLLHYWKATGQWPDFCSDATLPYDCKKEAAKYPV